MLQYKDYPQLPFDLVNLILDEVARRQTSAKFNIPDSTKLAIDNEYGKLVTHDLVIDGLAKMIMFTLDPLTTWVTKNIPKKINAIHVQYFEDGTFFFPHVDLLRSKAINYVLATADATTSFYTPNGFDPVPNSVIEYDKITLAKQFKIEPYRWHELDVTTIHSVEDINGVRIAVTLSVV